MTDLSSLLLDEEKVDNGIELQWEGDIFLTLAPMHNKRMEEFIRRKTMERSRAGRARRLTDEESEQITNEAVARCVLVGWRNLQQNGEDVPYSWQKALELLTHPGLTHLYRFVMLSSSDDAQYRVELEEDVVGNS